LEAVIEHGSQRDEASQSDGAECELNGFLMLFSSEHRVRFALGEKLETLIDRLLLLPEAEFWGTCAIT
jgi:hypothetical protein